MKIDALQQKHQKKRLVRKRRIDFSSYFSLSRSPAPSDGCDKTIKYYVRMKANSLDLEDLGHASVGIPLSCCPRGPRSKGKVPRKRRVTTVPIYGDSAKGISKECPGIVSSTADKCVFIKGSKKKNERKNKSRDSERTVPRRKRKTKQEDESSGSEVAVPRHIRLRGQARRSRDDCKTSIKKQGKHIWNAFPEEKVKSFVFFDPIWFNLYADEKNRVMVLNWIKEIGTFTKKYVLVPIVLWSHWSLLIFCHLGEGLDSKSKTPCMLLLDSLHAIGPKRLEPLIRRLLIDIYTIEGSSETMEQLKKMKLLIPKVPQQRKGEECGYLVLYYINLFIESAPENFSASDDYPYFMKEDWFTIEGLESFYEKLDSLPDVCDAHNDSASDDSSDCIVTTFSLSD